VLEIVVSLLNMLTYLISPFLFKIGYYFHPVVKIKNNVKKGKESLFPFGMQILGIFNICIFFIYEVLDVCMNG
jgi:hypothetical protein